MSSRNRLGAYRIHSLGLRDLGFSYDTGETILDNVSFELPTGGTWHLTGPAGHGQSTLLKILALLTPPSEGKILVNGFEASEMSFEEFLPWRLEIGYTFEGGGLLANRTLEENLMLPHLYHNLAEPDVLRAEIHSVAERFRFSKLLDRRPATVPGGLRKLITILRPVLLRPSFLVMDNPFSGLDPEMASGLEALIRELRDKSEIETICFTSRDNAWPARLQADSLWLEGGKVELRSKKTAA